MPCQGIGGAARDDWGDFMIDLLGGGGRGRGEGLRRARSGGIRGGGLGVVSSEEGGSPGWEGRGVGGALEGLREYSRADLS